jgi:hypothetical protein
LPFSAWETVVGETPATEATSRTVGRAAPWAMANNGISVRERQIELAKQLLSASYVSVLTLPNRFV